VLLKRRVVTELIFVAQMIGAIGVFGAEIPCTVCAGVRVDDPIAVLGVLAMEPKLGDDDAFFLAWTVPLDGTAAVDSVDHARRAGAQPWLRVVFRTPQPIADNLARLDAELEKLAALVRAGGEDLFVQAVWMPDSGAAEIRDHAFLIKRAAVAVTGASPDAKFIAGPLEADSEYLRAFYREEVAAYLDLIALAPGDNLTSALVTLGELDPGKPVVLDALPMPGNPGKAVARVAESAAAGIAITLFEAGPSSSVDLAPLKWMAREFHGNLVFDPYSSPSGARASWSFVREDLGLRVVAEAGPGAADLDLVFADPWFRTPTAVDLATGQERLLYDTRRGAEGLTVRLHEPDDTVMLRLERLSAEELEAFGQQIDVGAGREMPVEEILRRLQAFEDAQARRLDHFQASRSLHLRFQAAQGAFEASYAGDFFYRRGQGFDWVWRDFFVGGVKWKSKKIPKVPLIQPEKVASLPAEIRLSKDYDYRLRGTETIDGRDCWVIDFRPIEAAPGRSLYRGTVWVDREIYARVRTRTTQVGLEGSVLAAEETRFYVSLDRNGARSEWTAESFVLPVRISGQQTFSILSATVPVEVETEITDVRINGEGFERNRAAALASDATMLRDTDDGLRYLKKLESGERQVETEFDSDRLFLVGGVFWDESVDYPLPLAGLNYLDLDFKDTGAQIDVFFAGAFLAAGIADPQLFGSRWNGGVNLDGLFFKTRDELFREGVVVPEEDVRRRTASADIFVGRPLARFLNFELTYGVRIEDFSRADDTAEDFILPQDTPTHIFGGNIQYNRAGYRLRLSGAVNRRVDWQFWGLPGNDEFDPDQKNYLRWQAQLGKTWWLPKFRRVRVFFEHLDGSNLDRFSGYDFGQFGDASVSGYQSGLVRAEKANGAHLLAGVNYFERVRFDLKADAVWASNAMTGLDNELLAGVGLEGTMTLPWQLIMNFEAGYAIAGPGKGKIALRVFFLKLFPGS
jgi:hypothetical protein